METEHECQNERQLIF